MDFEPRQPVSAPLPEGSQAVLQLPARELKEAPAEARCIEREAAALEAGQPSEFLRAVRPVEFRAVSGEARDPLSPHPACESD